MTSTHPTIADFDDVLEGRVANGIMTYEGIEDVDDLASRAGAAGWQLIHLDGSAISSKAEYLQAWCDAGRFPETFGQNWDALADAMTDLSWLHASGYVVFVDGLVSVEPWAQTGWELLAESCQEWADNGTGFVTLRRD